MTVGHKKAKLWYKYYDTFIYKCGWKVNINGVNRPGRYYSRTFRNGQYRGPSVIYCNLFAAAGSNYTMSDIGRSFLISFVWSLSCVIYCEPLQEKARPFLNSLHLTSDINKLLNWRCRWITLIIFELLSDIKLQEKAISIGISVRYAGCIHRDSMY